MFIVLPIGHDRPVYDRPYLTLGLIVACGAVFALTWLATQRAYQDLAAAALEVDRVAAQYPSARVPFEVRGLPSALHEVVAPLIDPSPARASSPGDPQLEAAMLDLVDALNRLPALRFGYRPAAPSARGAIGHVFMHGDLFHLLGNMLFLWVAGGVLECFWRRWAFVGLYVVSAAAGLTAHHLSAPGSFVPLIGASGAIAGLIGAYAICYPTSRVRLGYFGLLLVKPVYGSWYVPAWIVIPLWAAVQLLYALLASGDGVAYWAHVGGFAAGLLAGGIARAAGWVATDDGHQLARG